MSKSLVRQTTHLLQQLKQLLGELGDDDFIRQIELLSGATIGQHTRHIIEFFQELNCGYDSGVVNYDARKRNLQIESDRSKAMQQLQWLADTLKTEDREVTLVCDPVQGESNQWITISSTYMRELLYNLEHTIHHMALLRIAVQLLSTVELPENFGVAESTIKYRKACAQ